MNDSKYPLAVTTPHIGAPSETFIRRHVQDLWPAGTAVVAGAASQPHAYQWRVAGPCLLLDTAANASNSKARILSRAKWLAARGFGLRPYERALAGLVKRFLRKHGVQVVLGEYLNDSLLWLTVAQDLGLRFFVHPHGYDYSSLVRSNPEICTEYLRYNGADGIITASHFVKTKLTAWGLEPARIHVVPYGVDVPTEPLTRTEPQTIRCIAVGRMVAKKSPILTLHAFQQALQEVPGMHLDYIGTGDLFPAAHEFVEAFHLHGRVTLHGSQPNEVVVQALRQADIFLQHSRTDPLSGDEEGMGVSLVEAMAQSLPVVATRHNGIPEVVQDGVTGYLAEEGDSRGMADRLVALARDAELRHRMGLAGWQRAKDSFSWERERKTLLRILGLGDGKSQNGLAEPRLPEQRQQQAVRA
jgi:glycosyltransferase involved in cell wall biosynthesis